MSILCFRLWFLSETIGMKGVGFMNSKCLTSWVAIGLWLVTLASHAASPANQAQLETYSDALCQLKINGKPSGRLEVGVKRSIKVNPGPVELLCVRADGVAHRAQMEVRAGEVAAARIRFQWEASADGVIDKAQRLVWARSDNGVDIDWTSAGTWCASKGAGWRLPTRAELEGLTAGSAGETTPCAGVQCKVTGLFDLTGYWMWSGDRDADGKALYHYLHTGHTQASSIAYQLKARVLCVRSQ